MASNNPLIGKKLGDYKITSLLATGGVAKIYVGLDEKLGREAAVKVLYKSLVQNDPTLAERFNREARAIARLDHQNIVSIYEFGYNQEADVYYLAMRYVQGRTLADELKAHQSHNQTMSFEQVARIMQQVASGLDYAHQQGIIHRDVKPSHILIDKNNRTYLTDFSISSLWSGGGGEGSGVVIGTPAYMSPEQGTWY